MYLRPADCSDASDLARLRVASLTEQGVVSEAQRPQFALDATRAFVRLFREDRIAAWVLVDESSIADETGRGTIAGSACAVFYERLPYPEGAEHAEIAGVYVAPAFRGAGFASGLVRETLATVRGRGVRATYLKPSSDDARRLYAGLGFSEMPFMRFEGERGARPGDPLRYESRPGSLPAHGSSAPSTR